MSSGARFIEPPEAPVPTPLYENHSPVSESLYGLRGTKVFLPGRIKKRIFYERKKNACEKELVVSKSSCLTDGV